MAAETFMLLPYVIVNKRRDLTLITPEIDLAAQGIRASYFCQMPDGAAVDARAGVRVDWSFVVDAGLTAVCKITDYADDLHGEITTGYGAGGRIVVIGKTLEGLRDAIRGRAIQLFSESPSAVLRAMMDADYISALRTLIVAASDPGDMDDQGFDAWRSWALSLFDTPGTASMYPPDIFISAQDTFAQRASRITGLADVLAGLNVDHFMRVAVHISEILMYAKASDALDLYLTT